MVPESSASPQAALLQSMKLLGCQSPMQKAASRAPFGVGFLLNLSSGDL